MESPKTGLSGIGETIQEALVSEAHSAEPIQIARAQLLDQVTAGEQRRKSLFASYFAARPAQLALVAGALAALCGAWFWLGQAISFDVGPRALAGRVGDVVQAAGEGPLPLRFSEGSSIVLHEGGRVRVLAADAAGARVLLESGEADVAIAHRARRWSFEAGPFHVLVTGTQFKVAWDPTSQALVVATKEGSVLISAPCLGAPRAVGAGARAELSCRKPTPVSEARPVAAPTEPERANGAEPSAVSAARAPQPARLGDSARLLAGGSAAASPASLMSEDGWRNALRAGQLAEALRAAESVGFEGVCERANGAELLTLADAARLSGSAARATEALLALRRRFPESGEAATAAFALGRIAFDQRADYADAARWFRAYLDQLPNGPLMGDAAGRLMEARFRQGDRAGARAEAERYLSRFPVGPYASEARKILAE